MEIGRSRDCATAEVKLNKNLDYTQGLVVYQEIGRQIRAPGTEAHGVRALVLEAVKRIRSHNASGLPTDEFLAAWVTALDDQDFPLPSFTRVLRRGLQDHLTGEIDGFEAAMRWLSGEVTDRVLARSLGESALSTSELRLHAHHARLSLYRFVRHAGFRGTILGFDEAEQEASMSKRRRKGRSSRISWLRSTPSST